MTALWPIFWESSIRALALAGAVAAMLWRARVRMGAVQHAAWAAVAGAMLLMPVLPDWMPAVGVRVAESPP